LFIFFEKKTNIKPQFLLPEKLLYLLITRTSASPKTIQEQFGSTTYLLSTNNFSVPLFNRVKAPPLKSIAKWDKLNPQLLCARTVWAMGKSLKLR